MQHYHTEQHGVKPNAMDFTLPSDGDKAVLIVHGVTASPYPLRDFAHFLNAHRMHVRVPRLPGHGTHEEDLERTSFSDMAEAVRQELHALRKIKPKVYVLGYSFGANLVLDVARDDSDKIDGMVLMSPAIRIRKEWLLRFLTRFYDRFTPVRFRPFPGLRKKSKEHLEERIARGYYNYIPVRSTAGLFQYIDTHTKQQLEAVTAPCLIMHPKNDPLTLPYSSQYIHDRIGSADKQLLIVDSHDHVLVSRKDLEVAYACVADFLKNH